MTAKDKALLGKLSAVCPGCGTVDWLARFVVGRADRAGLPVLECRCGCGQQWRRIDTLKDYK